LTESQYRAIKAAILLGLSIGIAVFLTETIRIEMDLRSKLDSLERPVLQLAGNWNAVAVTSSQVLSKERNAFDSQQQYYSRLTASTDLILEDVHATILPKIVLSLDHANDAVDEISGNFSSLAHSGSVSLGRMDPLLDALTGRVNDPRYDSILTNADQSMSSLNRMMADGAAVTANAKVVSDHYTKIILAPASKMKAGVLFAASVAGRFLRIL